MDKNLNRITATPAEIETIYGIPKGSLANMRWQGKGPKYFRVGKRRILYRLEDIQQWIESHPIVTNEDV